MTTIRFDSFKKFTPQNLVDETQKMIDAKEVADIIIVVRNKDGIRYLTSPISDAETIGMLEMTKLAIFNN